MRRSSTLRMVPAAACALALLWTASSSASDADEKTAEPQRPAATEAGRLSPASERAFAAADGLLRVPSIELETAALPQPDCACDTRQEGRPDHTSPVDPPDPCDDYG